MKRVRTPGRSTSRRIGTRWSSRASIAAPERVCDGIPRRSPADPHSGEYRRTDRCVSCHVGIEDARMRGLPLPYRAHSGTLLATHPPERFGCTVCHGGIGQSLNRQESCGAEQADLLHVPFVSLQAIESSCGRCHLAMFDTSGAGMPALLRGKLVFRREGCLGCHRVRGKGGSVGPDLTNEGSRNCVRLTSPASPVRRRSRNWMRRHFMDPGGVSPGSSMPAFALPDEDIEP